MIHLEVTLDWNHKKPTLEVRPNENYNMKAYRSSTDQFKIECTKTHNF